MTDTMTTIQTNARDKRQQAWKLADQVKEQTGSQQQANLVGLALMAEADAEERLADAAERVANRCMRVQQYVERGQSVNGLGELQGSALDVDRLCAELVAARTHAALVRKAFGLDDE